MRAETAVEKPARLHSHHKFQESRDALSTLEMAIYAIGTLLSTYKGETRRRRVPLRSLLTLIAT